jgi:hypothetical protein
MDTKKNKARSKAEFFRLTGIRPELAEFVTDFVERPEKFISMPAEKRREIEDQMDAIIYSLGRS